MKVGKALRLVMQRWQITKYRLSKLSDVVETTVGKLVNGELESTSWDKVEKLADGFGKIDPMAKCAFLGMLSLPDSAYSTGRGVAPLPYGLQEELERIRRILKAQRTMGLINQKAVEALEDKGIPIEQLINLEAEKLLAQEESQEDA